MFRFDTCGGKWFASATLAMGALGLMASSGQASLVGQWTFNDVGDGGQPVSAADTSGNGNSAELNGGYVGAISDVGGATNISLYLGGSGGYARIPYISAYAFQSYTIEFFGKIVDSGFDVLVGQDSSGLAGLQAYAGYAYHDINGGGAVAGSMTYNAYHHIVGTYDDSDGSSSTGVLKVYVDGALLDTLSNINASVAPLSQTLDWFIGRDTASGTPSLKAWVDEVRLYNTALSDAQVLADYQAGPTIGVPEPGSISILLGAVGLMLGGSRRRRIS